MRQEQVHADAEKASEQRQTPPLETREALGRVGLAEDELYAVVCGD